MNSPNHQVREASCLAVSEIYLRLSQFDPSAFKPYAISLARILLTKVKGEPYYGVRNQSITALSHIVKAYKEEVHEVIPDLIDLWFSRLSENVATVRESAAIAIVASANTLDLNERVREYIKANILKAKDQKPEAPL